MNSTDLDELLKHAREHGEAVVYTPAKLTPLPGEHRRPVFELVPAPAEGEPIPEPRELDP